ncbi:MAG: divergent polysaccharide deacetylase family protein [Rhodospirillaceae bacterium]|nr:divergent polysaccharide deacetylase family protein [Rhodospirillaceae bacterium]
MALSDTISGVMEKVRGIFQRKSKAMDAFGGDDLFDGDGEPQEKNLGPKIALAVSGVMLLALVSLVGAIMMTSDQTATSGGSLADLQVEEEPDPTATTDRSVERRPWLTPTDGGTAAPRRLGVDDTKTAAAAPAPAAPGAKPAPTPAPPPAVKPAEQKPAETKVAETKPAETKTADAKPAPAETKTADAKPADAKPAEPAAAAKTDTKTEAPAATPEAPKDTKPAETAVASATPPETEPTKPDAPKTGAAVKPATPPADDEESEEQQQAALPSLLAPAETAPGAPRRFDTADVGAATAGGRPRLNDPKLPPTDRASVGAPPPRFNAIADIKAPPPGDAKTPKLAIVVEGLGLNRTATEAALTKLPPVVTLAFSPYARDLKRLMERAKAKGHEVLIEVPMEGKNFPAEDPGPLGLLTGLESKDNQERLDTILKEANGAVGVFDGMGSKFRENPTNIGEVLSKLKQQNLFYVQGRPGVRVGESEVPSATTDVVIDERPFRAAVDARFDFAEKVAKYQGTAVAVMAARPISFERLALWMDQLPKKGVSLAPVSQVLVK